MRSKRNLVAYFLLVLAAGAAAVFFWFQGDLNINYFPQQPVYNVNPPVLDPISIKVSQMSLDEKIGQLLIVGFANNYLDLHIKAMITEYHIGGINLLKRNIKDQNQVKQLAHELQQLAATPLLIATDQEGGNVVRLGFLKQLTPQTAITSAEQGETVAFARALELKDLGINMNFSPVLDYVSDTASYLYSRTFGATPDKIAELGEAMIMGYRRGGIVPVAKHFPGYGNISLDPHVRAATLTLNSKELEDGLYPFKKVSAGDIAPAIMTAHVSIPLVDVKPATLSSKFLTDILRTNFGFTGVIITDDLEMASVGIPVEKAAVEAISAGADMIISTYTTEKHAQIFNALKTAVADGIISEERISESVTRVLKLKSSIGLDIAF